MFITSKKIRRNKVRNRTARLRAKLRRKESNRRKRMLSLL